MSLGIWRVKPLTTRLLYSNYPKRCCGSSQPGEDIAASLDAKLVGLRCLSGLQWGGNGSKTEREEGG